MTSLDLAFDDDFETKQSFHNKGEEEYNQLQSNSKQQPQQPQQQPQAQLQPQQPQPRQQPKENFTDYQVYQETPQRQMRPQIQQSYQYSFWDRMVMSRREVMKLFILSIVIILGISLEKIGCHYINQYLTSNDLTNIQEFLVRLSFPIIIFIILWIIKSL